jgi:Uma2 family endonuclease
MPVVSTIKMTARQFLELGEDPPGVRLELVDGEVAVSPIAVPDHSYIVFALGAILKNYLDQKQLGQLLGDVDTIFGPHDVRRPDILYFSQQRRHLIGKKAIEGPPDLCVEVISPSSMTTDREDKFEQYATGGVAFYWIIDPQQRTIEGYRLVRDRYEASGKGQGQDIVRLPPFEGLEIPLSKLWRPQ